MNRSKIEDVLLAMGVPAAIKGFIYIADAIEMLGERGTHISITKELYPAIAKKNNTTPSRVERAIRHAFEVTRRDRGDCEAVEKYIGFVNCENSSSLVMLYKRIQQECEKGRKETIVEKMISPEVVTDMIAPGFREIIRQELRMFLEELKAVQT